MSDPKNLARWTADPAQALGSPLATALAFGTFGNKLLTALDACL